MRLAGKRAVVTGSTKGIGLGIARAFVREGARVVVNARNADECSAIAKELGDCAVAIPADLSKSAAYFVLSQELGRGMLERGRGSVINVGSMNGTQPFPQRLAQC